MTKKRRCCICGKGRPVTLHGFPKDDVNLALWKQVCNYDDKDKVSNLLICSNHFLPEDYIDPNAKNFGGVLKLKSNRVPSVSVPNRLIKCESMVAASVSTENEVAKSPERIVPSPVTVQTIAATLLIQQQLFPAEPQLTESVDTELDETLPHTPKKRRVHSPRYIGEITSADLETPRRAKRAVALAQAEVQKKTRLIKSLRSKVTRLEKRVASLENIIKHLAENVLSKDVSDTSMVHL
nr:uncharacterized protein LOC111413536 [Onthophagus taurus]